MAGDAEPGPELSTTAPVEAAAPLGVWERIKDHKVIQWGVAYSGGAFAIAQAQELLGNAFEWPNIVGRLIVIALIVGLPIALTVAWYHGHRSHRRVGVGELSILSTLVLIGALAFIVVLRRDTEPSGQAPTAAPLPIAVSGGDALPNKVAVLPCENQSPDPGDAYFASGLHQDIIWQLDKLRNLTPIPRVAVLRYAGTTLSIAEIAAELSVRALLDCTVRYADNRVRITAELVDAASLQTLWQGTYEPGLADISDVFAVQADIAMHIADALAVVFSPGERELLARPPTVSTDAYLLFLKAYEEPDYSKTIALLEQSVAADESFAAPRAALAFLWATELINTNYSAAIPPAERAAHEAKARAAAQRALALDAKIPFARSALTLIDMLNWHWTDAYERLVRARELTPNDVTQYDIFLLSYLGRYAEAMTVVQRGEQLYPHDPDNAMWRGWALGFAAEYDDAAAAFAAIVDDVPGEEGRLLARDWLARMHVARGNESAALEQLRLSEATTAGSPQPLFMPMWAYAYGRLGRSDDARRIFGQMQEREAGGARFGAGGWAMASLAVGDRVAALDWLEKAAAKAANHELDEGFFHLMALRANIMNDDVLRQPEFNEVLGRIKGE
jgi:pentatricopeptide repeat protein